jgi:hypothetical protein
LDNLQNLIKLVKEAEYKKKHGINRHEALSEEDKEKVDEINKETLKQL